MTISTNATFDGYHAEQHKTPLYVVQVDGESIAYCNHYPGSPVLTYKRYLESISGHSQTIKPEKGESTIGGINVRLVDLGHEVTARISAHAYYWHRKKITIKAGYVGMDESDLIYLFVGWVTGMSYSDGIYNLTVTDPQKWMQRNIFRNASDGSPVAIQGNPLNILMAIITSTGAGTNGDYDYYAEEDSLGIDTDYVDISGIESIRDSFYPGDSNYMKFTITEKIKAKDFIEKQICRPLAMYPAIDGIGRFKIIPYRPPSILTVGSQELDETNIIGIPSWDANLNSMINEIEFKIDKDEEDYSSYIYIDSDSVNNRGPASTEMVIESDGLRTDMSPGSISGRALDIIERRKTAIFHRWSDPPPIKLSAKCFFSRYLSEAGDIISIEHSKLPNLEDGNIGISDKWMEVVNRSIDWKNGNVMLDLLDTGFKKLTIAVIEHGHTIDGGYYISP
jgi:hypothetical protein